MRETLIATAIIAGLLGIGYVATVPFEQALAWGGWAIAGGMAVGVPTGAVYHVLLHRALAPRGALKSGWIWRPLELNAALTREERRWVMPWCYVGGLGFVFVVLGIAVVGVSILSTWAQLRG